MTEAPRRRPRIPMTATVRRTEQISPSMVRVVLGGDELGRFTPSPSTDSYVKLVFLAAGFEYPRPLDLGAVRETLPPEAAPRLRTYTVRAFDAERAELTLDVVVHGDEGLAGPWARNASVGDEVLLLGPGGGYAPDPSAAWHLLIGDESALPAIAVAAEALPSTARAHVVVEVAHAGDEISLDVPPAAHVTWVHRDGRRPGEGLVAAVRQLSWPEGLPQAFVHGEAGFVRELRRWLLVDRGVPREQISISGYWRLGTDDEGWRAAKADWNRVVEDDERLAGVG